MLAAPTAVVSTPTVSGANIAGNEVTRPVAAPTRPRTSSGTSSVQRAVTTTDHDGVTASRAA
ncbi:hypothetical protein GQ85_02890 [Rhodococcus rhodochrous]|nr:hypothetical protein GQ85_02890 [Rhodococcus rhodochrous]